MDRSGSSPYWLDGEPRVEADLRSKVRHVYESTSSGDRAGPAAWVLDEFKVDMASHYGGAAIKNPFGKASGQLSLQASQVQSDAVAGLGFVVLKTVIAEDASGRQAMRDWAIRESHMLAERIRSKSGAEGWTISWKGRGWWQSLEAYLDLVRAAQELGRPHKTLIIPSCKYHLPTPEETTWKQDEYRYTTERLLEAYLGEELGVRGQGSGIGNEPTR